MAKGYLQGWGMVDDDNNQNVARSVKGHNQNLVNIAREALQAYKQIQDDLYIPDDSKPQLLVEKKEEYRQKLNQAVQAAKKTAESERLQARVQAARSYMPEDPSAYTVAESERSWRRMKGLMDAGVDPAAVLQDAVDRGSMRDITVFDAEYKSYRWQQTGSLNDAQRETDSIQPLLDKVRYDTGSETHRSHADKAKEAAQLGQIVAYNASAAQQAVSGDEGATLMGNDGSVMQASDDSSAA